MQQRSAKLFPGARVTDSQLSPMTDEPSLTYTFTFLYFLRFFLAVVGERNGPDSVATSSFKELMWALSSSSDIWEIAFVPNWKILSPGLRI